MQDNLAIESNAAEQILESGVPMRMGAPFFLRWIGIKSIRITFTSLMTGTMLRVARIYLKTGITDEQLTDITTEQALGLMVEHGKAISKAVACAAINRNWRGKLFTPALAWYMRWHCSQKALADMMLLLLIYGGVSDFMDTTRSARLLRITQPNLGHQRKGS